MKTKLLLIATILYCGLGFAQINVVESFETAFPTGWTTTGQIGQTGGFSRGITTFACDGSYALSASLYPANGFAMVVTSDYVSDGNSITTSFKYTRGIGAVTGNVYLYYDVNNSGTWQQIAASSDMNPGCITLSASIPSAAVPAGSLVKFRMQINSTSNISVFIDDFKAIQQPFVLEYTFNNTLSNIDGAFPFSTGVANASFVADRNGNANSAVQINANVTGLQTVIQALPKNNAPRSFSIWYKTSANNNADLFTYGTACANCTFGTFIGNNGNPAFATGSTGTDFGGTYPVNIWRHLVITYNGTEVKMFMNGALLGTAAHNLVTGNNSAFRLGGAAATLTVDDLKMYDSVLTDAQALNLYYFNSLVSPTPIAPIVSNLSSDVFTNKATISYSFSATNDAVTSVVNYGTSSSNLSSQMVGLATFAVQNSNASVLLTGLTANTQYFYQVVVTNSLGPVSSVIENFTTNELGSPIAHYNFNATYNNIKGNTPFTSNTGTSFVVGKDGVTANGALNINNTGSTATIPDLPYGNSPRTISFWAKTNTLNTLYNTLYSYGSTVQNQGVGGTFNSSNISYVGFSAYYGANLAGGINNTWFYFAFVYDGTNAKIYRNGVLVVNVAATFNTVNLNDIFRLGRGTDNVSQFNGAIDELKIYDYALTDGQVSNLFNFDTITSPSPIAPAVSNVSSIPQLNTAAITYSINANYTPTTSVINYGTLSTNLSNQQVGFTTNGNSLTSGNVILSGLLANTQYYYQIVVTNSVGFITSTIGSFTTLAVQPSITEYTFNNTFNNINGNSPFSTNTNLSFVADRNATALSALRINGTGSSAIITGLPTGTSTRSISIWYKVSTASNDNCLFVYGQSGGENAYGVSFNNTNTWYNFAWTTNTSMTNPSNDGNWHHLVTTFDQSKTSRIYVDGVLKNTVVQNGWNTSVNSNTFWLGSLFSPSASLFNGTVDDLKIYDRALTQAEVTSLFTNNTLLSSQNFSQNNLEVSLYPNPATDVLNIEMTNEVKSVEIYSLQGQKVMTSTLKQINVSSLSKGMYLVKVTNADNNSASQKLIVK